MFLTAQDFDDYPYILPDLDKVENSFADFVSVLEEEALRRVLGRLLYLEFKARMEDSVLDPGPIPLADRWAKLKNGAVYLYNGRSYEWVGMKKMLKPHIYAEWTRKEADSQNGSGVSVPKVENATVISPGQRISRGHNAYSHYSGHCRVITDTLYGYLYFSEDVYLDVVSTEYKTIQEYIRLNYKDPGLQNMFSL